MKKLTIPSNITRAVHKSLFQLKKHSPEILVGIGVTGMITSTVLAVKATPKAMSLLVEAEQDKAGELTVIETVKAAWKPYIPTAVTGLSTIACILRS